MVFNFAHFPNRAKFKSFFFYSRIYPISMWSSNLLTASLVILVSVLVLFSKNDFSSDDYFLKPEGDIFLPELTNAGGHVYPYMATIVSMSCLIVLIMIIICFGAELGGE